MVQQKEMYKMDNKKKLKRPKGCLIVVVMFIILCAGIAGGGSDNSEEKTKQNESTVIATQEITVEEQDVIQDMDIEPLKEVNDDYLDDNSTEKDSKIGYILPDSNSRYLTETDLQGLDQDTLRLARNEIYARHDRLFKTEDLNTYFSQQSWYHGYLSADEFDDSVLNEYERSNLELIKSIENSISEKEKKESSLYSINFEDIFPSDGTQIVSWHSHSTGYYMIPEATDGEPVIYFSIENNTISASLAYGILVDSIDQNEYGGLVCTGRMYPYTKSFGTGREEDFNGTVEVTWNSLESIDFPSIRMVGEHQMMDVSMIASDYSYYGLIGSDYSQDNSGISSDTGNDEILISIDPGQTYGSQMAVSDIIERSYEQKHDMGNYIITIVQEGEYLKLLGYYHYDQFGYGAEQPKEPALIAYATSIKANDSGGLDIEFDIDSEGIEGSIGRDMLDGIADIYIHWVSPAFIINPSFINITYKHAVMWNGSYSMRTELYIP